MAMKMRLLLIGFTAVTFLAGCTTPELEYRHVQLTETAEPLRYVDPREETEMIRESNLENVDTFSIYLYEPTPDVPFNYTHFFTFLEDYMVYEHSETGELYIRELQEIREKITQYYIDKDAFENQAGYSFG